jgi:hypothetical protein
LALACKGPTGQGEACADERTALANLPLDAMFGVALDRRPRANGKRAVATIEFGRSGRDGESWRITLLGQDRLDEVRMERRDILYH